MSKKSIIMLVFACVFATIALGLLVVDSYFSISTYTVLFGSHPENLGEAVGIAFGVVILYAMTIMFGIFIVASCVATLPFNIILMKTNGKKWYSIALLVFIIIATILAIVYVAMLPIVSKAEEAARASSSSSSNIDSSSALLFL